MVKANQRRVGIGIAGLYKYASRGGSSGVENSPANIERYGIKILSWREPINNVKRYGSEGNFREKAVQGDGYKWSQNNAN
jgi:hypothetical protein